MKDLAERTWSKIDRAGPEDCWPWLGGLGQKGGPVVWRGEGRGSISTRRVVWEHVHGVVLPRTRQVATNCGNVTCLNPAHLYLRPWQDDEARFWSHVQKVDGDGCWEWQSTFFRKPGGYAYASFKMKGKQRVASRVAWELTHGPIEGHVPGHPELEVCVCHHCDNPKCVRPDHLFLGSDADNCADKVAKGRQSRGPALAAAVRLGRMSRPTQAVRK
jgi:hypothetical protein